MKIDLTNNNVCWKQTWWWWWLFHRFRWFLENVQPFIPRLHFVVVVVVVVVVCFVFVFEVEISSRTLIPLFTLGSVHRGSASGDDCGRMVPDKLRVSSFPDRFPHCARTAAQSARSNFVGSKVYACLRITCNLHFWQNERGLLRATVVTRGWNGHRIRVSTQN